MEHGLYLAVRFRAHWGEPLFFDCDSLVFENDSFILAEKMQYFLLFHFGMVFQHVSFHFLGISFHAKIETWRGGGRSEQKNML